MDTTRLASIAAAAATIMSLDATTDERIEARPVVISAIVEIVLASKWGMNATAIRRKLKALGITMPRSSVASLAYRAVQQGHLEFRSITGISYVEPSYHAPQSKQEQSA